MRSKKLTNKKQKIFSEKQKDLGMACHISYMAKQKWRRRNVTALNYKSHKIFWQWQWFCMQCDIYGLL